MDDIKLVQKEIIELYIDAFKHYRGGLKLSVPLIPRISEAFLRNRVVIVGQETNTWYRTDNRPDTDDLQKVFLKNLSKVDEVCLEKRYDFFIKNTAGKYGGNFWRFQRLLYKRNALGSEMIENSALSHCWVNLFAVEACVIKGDKNGRPTKSSKLAKEIISLQQDLLFKTLKVLKPRLVLFLTGSSLDYFLKKYGISDMACEWKSVDDKGILTTDNLAEICIETEGHPLRHTKIVRAYHPSYFMGYINGHKTLKAKFKLRGDNVSEYYTNVLCDKIESMVHSVHF